MVLLCAESWKPVRYSPFSEVGDTIQSIDMSSTNAASSLRVYEVITKANGQNLAGDTADSY